MQDLMQIIETEDLEKLHQELINDPSLVTPQMFFRACEKGSFSLVRYMTEYSRISLNEKDDRYRGCLHYAARSGNRDLFVYLTEKCCCDPLEGDKTGKTPWDEAISAGSGEIVAYLEDRYQARREDFYENPIRTGFFPDPSIIRVGEDYYMVNSSFVFFPCIPVSHSRDLVNWEIIGYAITNPDWARLDELEGGRGYWAPDISYFDGLFHITATYRRNDTHPGQIPGPLPSGLNADPVYEGDPERYITYRRQMIVTSPRPEGPYSEPVWIDEDGIDPCLFHDEDGRNYMLLNRGARILELDRECKKQISPARMLCYGDNKRAPEGPHLFRKDGYYYLLLAEGGTGPGHRVSIFRSRELMGYYEPCPINPILRQWQEDAPIQRCGHGELVDTPDGRWYMAYLCGRKKGDYTILGRETALEPVEWTAEGWPIVNRGRGPSAINKKPFPEGNLNTAPAGRQEALAGRQEASAEHKEDSCVTTLPTDYLSPRPWQEGGVTYEGPSDGTGVWTLQASPAPFDSVRARNLMLRRQLSFDENVQVYLDPIRDMPEGAMAGLLGYYDENSFLFFGLTMEKGTKKLLLWQHIGTEDEKEIFELPTQAICGILLRMEVRGLGRRFLYETEGQRCPVKTLEQVTYLSDEGVSMGKRFTGVLSGMGVYAQGEPLKVTFRDFQREDTVS